MPIINSVMTWILKKRFHQIELFMKYPHEVQHELFKDLLYTARHTWWGNKYDYSSINTLDEFKERVPVSTYDDLKPVIDRMLAGEKNVIWPTDIKWFAKSSGTTSDKSKYIPVSKEALEDGHYRGGKDMLSIYVNNFEETEIFSGRGLAIGGSHRVHEAIGESFYVGDLSAIIVQNLPRWAEMIRIPKRSVALMDEWERKMDMMADATIGKNVTNLSGVPSWTLILLQHILEKTGKKNIREVWPKLEVFFHGGVKFEPYQDRFDKVIGDQINYWETYNASEGFFGIQDQKYSKEMLLMLDYGIYYEFMTLDQLNKKHPKTLDLSEVETGKNYAMIITTNAGLWRYMIGDTVTFTNLKPYRIKITGRTKNFINIAGEEVIVENAEEAIRIACEKSDAVVNEFTAGPLIKKGENTAAHEWIIEFKEAPKDLGFFTEMLDNALKALNTDYEAKRYHSMVLTKPLVHAVPENTFYSWLKSKGKLGGQNKVPRLSNDRKHLEELLMLF